MVYYHFIETKQPTKGIKMKKLVTASILLAASFTVNASCFSLVSNVLDEVAGAVSTKATSSSAISLYVSTCELNRTKAIHKIGSIDDVKKELEKDENKLNDAAKDVGTVNYIVGVKSFATFNK